VNLNFSKEVFKCVNLNIDDENEKSNISFIDAYKNRSLFMESICLIDVAKSWIYNHKRKGWNLWSLGQEGVIVRIFPRFLTIPTCDSNKWIDFCTSKLLLYKPFHDLQTNIGNNDESIIATWDNFNYIL
jgi:hypothetical protein